MTAPILYVEDEEDYQILVTRILDRAGLRVTVAENGEDGMRRLRGERPGLLLLDVNLPDTDGYRFCRQLREDPAWADLPVLMLTVRRRPEEWLRGFSSGATDYISKPLNPPELVERVLHGLEGKTRSSPGHGTPEYHLIRAAVSGNRAAFEVLIQKYKERLTESLRYAVRRDVQVEDVVADAFALAFEKLGEFRGEASFYTWVYRIAMNESIGVYRRPGSYISLDELTANDSHLLAKCLPEDSMEKEMTDKQDARLALEALRGVPALYRQILEMYFLRDLSYEAIARALGIPTGTVMSRLHKARKLLQNASKKMCVS